jgi:ribosomal-protein-serine acetyltransferase
VFSHQIDKNLKLALPELSQAEEVTAIVRANLSHLQPWMAWATDDYSVESAKEWIQRMLNEFAQDGRFGASILVDEKVVGSIGFHNLDTANGSAHIGYWIAKEYEGRGIITRCCEVLVDYLFEVRRLNRIQINCNVENTRSRAVPERLGFKLEGIHRQVEFVNGRHGDWAVYAILKEEWRKNG